MHPRLLLTSLMVAFLALAMSCWRDAPTTSQQAARTRPGDAGRSSDADETPIDAGGADAADVGDGDTPDASSLDAGADDGGDDDAGADAGVFTEALALSVVANPTSVLSAVALVRWSEQPQTVSVLVQGGETMAIQGTPPATVKASASSIEIPLLPLKAGTAYRMTARGLGPGGEQLTSASVSFVTGAMPADVPFYAQSGSGTPSPGYTLVARTPDFELVEPDYLTITDDTGAPVWYFQTENPLGGDFQQQPDGTFTIAQVSTFWQIDVMGTLIRYWGAVDISNASDPLTFIGTNNHELRMLPNGDVLLYGDFQEQMDLTSFGGVRNAEVQGDVLERVTPDNHVAFAWNAFDAVSVADIDPAATSLTGDVVDFTHANAIDIMLDGNYLVSLRNLSQVLKINSRTGDVVWRLGGINSDFQFLDDPLGRFSCQHGARELPNGHIILFDDGDGHIPPQSRAAEYKLDMSAMTATLAWSSEDTPPLYTYVMGYADRLQDGDTLIAYGTTLHAQEVDPTGHSLVWELSDSLPDFAFYRAYRLTSLSPLALRNE